MSTFAARATSLLVLVGWVIAAQHLDALALMKIALPMLLATACIRFPDSFGDFSGVIHYRAITTRTPRILVGIVGWILLLGLPPLVWYGVIHVRTV